MALKDAQLASVCEIANVAQFVSFNDALEQRHSALRGNEPNKACGSLEDAADALLKAAGGSVNVRTFHPELDKNLPFHYGLTKSQDVVNTVKRSAADGLYTIINETIDIHDGGVSGVFFGTLAEFAPDDTPRCVDKPGTVALDWSRAVRFFESVFELEVDRFPFNDATKRVEFSVHPRRCGYRHERLICWEIESFDSVHESVAETHWPNRLSRKLGDKAFGLLVASVSGLPVPRTQVVPRTMPPFSFGEATGVGEKWLRTCPSTPEPGKYATVQGWVDPFRFMTMEDADGSAIPSLLIQDGVEAQYSGALAMTRAGAITIEGVRGLGDRFMLGQAVREVLPAPIRADVEGLARSAAGLMGSVRAEWVHDGETAWVVQLHHSATSSRPGVIVPGKRDKWVDFDPEDGLDNLREMLRRTDRKTTGIVVTKPVGVTSHVGDLIRRARVPAVVLSPSQGLQESLFDADDSDGSQ